MEKRDDLRAAQLAIVAALTQHQAYSHRASSAVVNRLKAEIDRLAKQLSFGLSERLDDLTAAETAAFLAGKYTTPRLKAMKAEIDGWGVALDQAIQGELGKSGLALAGYESAYAVDLLDQALDGLPKVTPVPEKVFAKAMEAPVMGMLLKDMIADTAPKHVDRVMATIRQGIGAGQANPDIIRALRGTKALNYRDGIMEAAKHDVERLVRTARNHIANGAYEQTYLALGVEYVQRSANLEGRTCKACAALDGQIYKVDSPKPAATLHSNCRCQYVPAIDEDVMGKRPFVRALKVTGRDGNSKFRSIGDMTKNQREKAGLEVGQVKASTTYSKWFGSQDAEFQREWLGKTRYELYNKGGYTLDKFSDPLTGKEYTISQMRQRDAETFKSVFGS